MRGFNMEALRRPVTTRISAGITLFFFIFVFYFSPVGIVIAQETENTPEPVVLTGTPEQKMNQGLLKLQEVAARKQAKVSQRIAEESSLLDDALDLIGLSQLTLEDVSEVQTLSTLLAEQHADALASFNQVEQDLIAKNLPAQILQRHQDTVAQYQAAYAEMQLKIQAALQADSLTAQQTAMDALDGEMKKHKLKKSHQKTDPNNLPWGTPDASKTRKPAETAKELMNLTGISPAPQNILLASNVITPEMLGQPGGPVAQDLAETVDIKFTDAIRAKALELKEDPVEIYNWVRNNIEFIPSYGSIQGAGYTLQNGKGNAFDTASLLIGLLRAANIPARYAYGTVEIPVDKVMNWVGGVEVPEAAQQLLGQGGIPNVALVEGGKITHIKMEHVWVEVWVDYFPSRAAKHVAGDSWIPLDASFKQYEYTAREDLENQVPFDSQSLLDQINQTAIVNDEEGSIQGVDPAQIHVAINNYQQQIEDYINTQNPDATIDEIMGSQKIIIQEFQTLAAGLPYALLVRTNNYSLLPDNMRHKFRYTLGTESYGYETGRLITFEESLPALAGKKLAMTFRPAGQADEDLLLSYMPDPDPITGEVDPTQLPSSLPGYLINLTGELVKDGEVVQSAGAGTMGSELYETLALWSPSQGWQQAVNHPIAGEYRAIGLDLQGSSAQDGVDLEASLQNTETIIENDVEAQLDALTKHDTTGDMLQTTIYAYLAMNDVQDKAQELNTNVLNYRLPSFGIFSTTLQTSYWFGIPRNASFDGLTMDVDHLATQTAAKNNNSEETRDFVLASGIRASALEHIVPEMFFSTDETPAHGISAVKALELASAEGQKIWTIDQSNLSVALAAINLGSDVKNEIANSVNAGKVAVAPTNPVDFFGSQTVGYLLIDRDTGAGAYKVGGVNGGLLKSISEALDKAISYLSLLEGKAGKVAKSLKKAIGHLKRLVQAVKGLVDILENCTAGAILGITMFITMMVISYFVVKFVATMVITASAGCGALALLCAAGGMYYIVGPLAGAMADMVSDTANYISRGCASGPL